MPGQQASTQASERGKLFRSSFGRRGQATNPMVAEGLRRWKMQVVCKMGLRDLQKRGGPCLKLSESGSVGHGRTRKSAHLDTHPDEINPHKTVRATHEHLLEVLGLQEQLAT